MSLWEAFYGRKLRLIAGIAGSSATTITLMVADLRGGAGNFSPGYLLPVIAVAPLGRRRLLWMTAFTMVCLTYLGYLSHSLQKGMRLGAWVGNHSLLNRSLIAFVIVAMAYMLDFVYPPSRPRRHTLGSIPFLDPRPLPSWLTTGAISPLVFLCLLLTIIIVVVDCFAPATDNWALLHLVPVAISALSGRRIVMWAMVVTALLATRAGFSIGPYDPDRQLVPLLLTNRFIVRFAIIGTALLLDPWIGTAESSEQGLIPPGIDTPGPHLAVIAPPRKSILGGQPLRRILFVDHSARLGGGEIALINLIHVLDKSRFSVAVVVSEEGPLIHRLREQGVETHMLPLDRRVLDTRKDTLGGSSLLRFREGALLLAYAIRLAHFIRRGRYDIVHTNSLKADIVGGLAARMTGRDVVWHVRDRIDPDYLPAPAVHAFRAMCCALADYVVTNSHASMGLLRPTFGDVFGERAALERMRVVHDGVANEAFEVPVHAQSAGVPVIGLLGRISPFKGQEYFIEAAQLIRRRFPAAKFRIIGSALFGENDYETSIRLRVKELGLEDSVEFSGFRADVGRAISELTILAHASVTGEPFGLVIAEGMAAGKPVVATQGGGVPEIIEDGVSGLLVPPRDPSALADAICGLLADPEKAAAMGEKGRLRIGSFFTIENSARKVEHFYDFISSRRGGMRVAIKSGLNRSRSPFFARKLHWMIWILALSEVVYSMVELARSRLG